jgi:phosphohistidine phosphatase SixA
MALSMKHPCRRFLWGIALYLAFGSLAWADENLWQALRSGAAVGLLRHALAPGGGDPAHFKVEDCATQRNLSEAGRQQARAIGAAFRRNGITAARVLSSRWCRCLDTARLLDLGPVEPFPPLDSFFAHPERAGPQTMALREFLARPDAGPSRVLVTHQVNITALANVVPRSGELIVVQSLADGRVRVIGRLDPGEVPREPGSGSP